MADTLTLADFLLARIAEDETVARDVAAERVRVGEVIDYPAEGEDRSFWADYDGAGPSVSVGAHRVLAECEAKRAIIDECRALINSFGDWDAEVGAPALWTDVNRRERSQAHGRLDVLAAVYADHPDYRDEWRP